VGKRGERHKGAVRNFKKEHDPQRSGLRGGHAELCLEDQNQETKN